MKLLIDGDLYCKACDSSKAPSDFHKDSSGKRGYAYYCKECAKEKAKEWQQKNKHKPSYIRGQANSFFQRNYGISLVEREEMLKKQGNCCAICKVSLEDQRIHTDHCHTTGKVRELLCSRCNHGLGSFRDSTEFLKSAITYLEKHT